MNPEHITLIDDSVQLAKQDISSDVIADSTAPPVPTFEVPTANFATAPPQECENENSWFVPESNFYR